MKPVPIQERLAAAYKPGITYHAMMRLVYPEQRSWRRKSGGGPPGCAISFHKALTKYGYWIQTTGGSSQRFICK